MSHRDKQKCSTFNDGSSCALVILSSFSSSSSSSFFNHLLIQQVYDSLFLMFAKRSYLQLLFSDINVIFYQVVYRLYPSSFPFLLPSLYHAALHYALTRGRTICVLLCPVSFCVLEPCVKFLISLLVHPADFLHLSPDPYFKSLPVSASPASLRTKQIWP